MKGIPMDNAVGLKKTGKPLHKEPSFDTMEWPGNHFTKN